MNSNNGIINFEIEHLLHSFFFFDQRERISQLKGHILHVKRGRPLSIFLKLFLDCTKTDEKNSKSFSDI